ncbi:MAG TPA: NAD(P)H-binding protein [Candidatus Brachybacterium merdigallinarum]|nr:NAD(P)H-binding protein [Candidatus Brachybacterium merdigallinarum]
MHHLVIGEGQVGREIVTRELADGDTVTILRRSPVEGEDRPGITRIAADVLDLPALTAAMDGADAVHATFHAPYDARIWEAYLPPRERAVLDAAAEHRLPVLFPESMYGYIGHAADLQEGADFAPRDAKGRIRRRLIEQRRAHRTPTLSLVAADLMGPTSIGTFSSVATAMVVEPILAGKRAMVPGALDAPHSLTFTPDLAAAMVHAARRIDALPADAVLHAPTAAAHSMRELAAQTAQLAGLPERRALQIPRLATRVGAPFSTLMRELSGISDLWYGPAVLQPGILTTAEGLTPTPWRDAVALTVHAARCPPDLASSGPGELRTRRAQDAASSVISRCSASRSTARMRSSGSS